MQEWMSARPDVCQARDLIHRNPVDALAPVAAASFPPRLLLTERQNSREVPTLICLSGSEPHPFGHKRLFSLVFYSGHGSCWRLLALQTLNVT